MVIKQYKRLEEAFPDLPPSFFNIFSERIKIHQFDDVRLERSVSGVIDSCEQTRPTIAAFINWDKKHPSVKIDEGIRYYLQDDGTYKNIQGEYLND